ncbi:MAG: hypothetical protein JWP82_2518 [Humibacillus sp.]|nr:hypothetical protein [Humibacillus sp.]
MAGTDERPPVTSEPAPEVEIDDVELLGQADWVIGGEAAAKARAQARYTAYVLALLALVYGFPFVQATFKTVDSGSLRDQLSSPVAYLVEVAAVAAVLVALVWAGRFRGPVVPPMPWIDLVLAAPVDRALALRRWWRYSVLGVLFVAGLSALTLSSGLAYAGVVGPLVIPVALVVGLALGVLAVRLWLWAQVRSWPGPDHSLTLLRRPDDALRELHSESLRRHSANTSTLTGSAMTGNLRTARLAFARPVIRGRGARLRPGRAVPVLVRRDVLGLRRQPSSALSGLGLTLLGSVVLAWALTQSAAPVIAVPVGLVPLYLGYGAWAEGLRLQADNIGTPSLLGTGPLEEAGAHLVVPTTLTALVLGASTAVAAALAGGSVPGFGGVAGVALSVLCVVGVLAGGHLMAAFRGSPSLQTGPQMLIAWYLLPAVVVLVVGSLLPLLLRAGVGLGIGVSVWLVIAVVLWGLHRVRRLTHLHRW